MGKMTAGDAFFDVVRRPRAVRRPFTREPAQLVNEGRRSLLIVTNLYPPLTRGGYELLCRDYVAWLRSQGHSVTVITSTYGLAPGVDGRGEEGASGERVVRTLDFHWGDSEPLRPGGVRLMLGERRQRRALQRLLHSVKPQAAIVWNMGGTSKSLLAILHRRSIPLMVVVGEPWPVADLDNDGWTGLWSRPPVRLRARLLKPFVRRMMVRFVAPADVRPALHAAVPVYASDHVRLEVEAARPEFRGRGLVIHNGIRLDGFYRPRDPEEPLGRPLQLLYAGRVERPKGVHTAVAMLGRLREEGFAAHLTIVGWRNARYGRELRAQAAVLGVDDLVSWRDAVEREVMADVYRSADVIVFPPVWAEPFGLVPLEAMASGCIVVATGRGGSSEYLRHGENSLLFPAEDDAAACGHVRRLLGDSALVARLRRGGLNTARQHRFEDYANRLDAILEDQLRRTAADRLV
jgi:glycosyltransferase involved in cell wall biosynthesis